MVFEPIRQAGLTAHLIDRSARRRPLAQVLYERRTMKILLIRRLVAVGLTVAAVAGGAAACSTSSSGGASPGASGGGGTYVVWDPYPQFDDSSAWVRLLQGCGSGAGVVVKRTAFDTTDLTSKV